MTRQVEQARPKDDGVEEAWHLFSFASNRQGPLSMHKKA